VAPGKPQVGAGGAGQNADIEKPVISNACPLVDDNRKPLSLVNVLLQLVPDLILHLRDEVVDADGDFGARLLVLEAQGIKCHTQKLARSNLVEREAVFDSQPCIPLLNTPVFVDETSHTHEAPVTDSAAVVRYGTGSGSTITAARRSGNFSV
jgi:hypothetical protein